MKDAAYPVFAVMFLLAVFAFVIWWKMSVWSECRTDHSFMYCMTMMGK